MPHAGYEPYPLLSSAIAQPLTDPTLTQPLTPPLRSAMSHPKYSLRPETVESFFFLWRLTRDESWRERGWQIFGALQQQCRTASGYAALTDVRRRRSHEDSMPSFWMAETLKYLYLLFGEDDVLPLDQWVFNTEAHPFRVQPG